MPSTKVLTIRMPKELWYFLRKTSLEKEISMNEIVLRCLNKYKEKKEKLLTDDDFMIE